MASINPDARAIAAERDEQRKQGVILGSAFSVSPAASGQLTDTYSRLHGIPLLLKDVFFTLDDIETTG